ncbi:RTA1 like protein-domain-containing protein [Xylariales sp. PMI_506]|nr:RTA1 like protein-domain-containing protein [Xylariales sp. PMI_506]
MSSQSQETVKYYHYAPNLAAACIFSVVFGALSIWHSFLIVKHKTRYFIPLIIGGIFELVGYAARAASSKQVPNTTLGPYVIQTLLLLVAPPLFAASIYMILGRIIVGVNGESYSLIRRRWLTKIFVASDVICFFIQLGGGGLMASSSASTAQTGSHIVLAGLLIQIIIFGLFIVVARVFHLRMRATPTIESNDPLLRWNLFLNILYVTSALILVRQIVRVAEFVEGFEGYIILHEAFLYVFDAVPMAAVMLVFSIWYPSQFSQLEGKSITGMAHGNVELPNLE